MSEHDLVEELRDSAVRFVRNSCDFTALRKRRRCLPGHDETAFAAIRELGWLGILVPEADGGLGLGFAEMAAVLAELERGLLGEPLLGLIPGIRALVHAEAGPARSALLAGMVTAETLPALALDRDAAVPAMTVREGRLTGRAGSVPSAHVATGFAVPVRTDAGVALYWVAADAPGVRLGAEWRADESALGTLELADAPAALLSADFAGGLDLLLDEARILASASMVGLLQHVMDMTLEYMRTRVQYDRPIGSFQALQHLAVDLHIQQEIAVSVLGMGLEAAASASCATERAIAAARTKGRCSDALLKITRGAIQIHGAIAITDEFDLGLFVKRALVLSAWLGNAAEQRARFASLFVPA